MLRGLSLAALFLAVPGAAAATTFAAGVACNGPGQVSQGPAPPPQSCSLFLQPATGVSPGGTGDWSSDASASAGPTGMHLSSLADAAVSGATAGSVSSATDAWAEWVFDDFIVTTTGSSSPFVLAATHLWVSGNLNGIGRSDNQGTLTSRVGGVGSIDIEIEINGANAGTGFAYYSYNNGSPREEALGFLAGHYVSGGSISDSITSGQVLIPVGQAFSVHVLVDAKATALVDVLGTPEDQFDTLLASGTGTSEFSSTVSFPTSGPIFDLPAGYTLNSVSAGIVNNQLVPEPGAVALLVASAVGLRAARRRFGVRLSD